MERKEAIEVIKKNWPDSSFTRLREALETLIPELKERIAWLEKQGEQIDFANKEYWRGYHEGKLEILDKYADLEKRSKQKLVEKYNITGIGSKNAQGKLGEMIKNLKPADKIEPKFKVGDWITDGNITIQIKAIENDCYLYCGDCVLYSTKTADKVYHIWTIEDAKDGDILAVEPINDYPSPFIAICKEHGLDFFNSHCFISFDAKFYTGDTGHDIIGIHPATKEQRDTLEKAMTDAGYTFDFEKKELKKIENKNPLLSDFFKAEYERGKADAQKPARSEEDEKMIQDIINDIAIAQEQVYCKSRCEEEIDWLKSLRPQKQWKPSEEQLKSLKGVIDVGYFTSYPNSLETLYEQLKKLKGEIKL